MGKKKHIIGDTCLSGRESALWRENHFGILYLRVPLLTLNSPSRFYFTGSDSFLLMISGGVLVFAAIFTPCDLLAFYISLHTLSLSFSVTFIRFVSPISKQTPFASRERSDRFFSHARRTKAVSAPSLANSLRRGKSVRRARLINVNPALSEIARSTSARFTMKTRIIGFTYNAHRDNIINFYAAILLLNGDRTLDRFLSSPRRFNLL